MRDFWRECGRPLSPLIALLGAAFVIAVFVVAPAIEKGSNTYIPAGVAKLRVGVLKLQDPEGRQFEIPVRIVDIDEARRQGLGNVGPLAMKTMLLFYAFKSSRSPTSYSTLGIRAPIAVAVIDEQSVLIEIIRVEPPTENVQVSARRRAVLFTRDTLFDLSGVGVGTVLPANHLRWLK